MKKIPQDIVGTIAILKFKKTTPWIIKKFKAWKFLKNHKHVSTVVEKTGKFNGIMRIPTTRFLAGAKTTITTYNENNCTFVFDINKTYFSPRLSNERKIVADQIAKETKSNAKILICFAGVAPYPIVIAKELKKNGIPAHIISNEINQNACTYAKTNVIQNKLTDYITVNCSDIKALSKQLQRNKRTFDIILMPRPNLEDTFLKDILPLTKKETKIYYHGFGTEEQLEKEIKKDTKGKIKNLRLRKAGDIGKEQFRWQAEFVVK